MSVYQSSDYVGLFRGNGHGTGGAFVVSDVLTEAGESDAMIAECRGAILIRWLDIWRFGIGSGIGSGRGIGSGSGSGSGRGIGIGSGSGSGRGIGIGSGSGSGSGRGIGRGSGESIYPGEDMRVGKCYLIHCGDWHTFVGRVEQQLGPLTYELTGVSKISDTNNGDNWHAIAEGDKRQRAACTYHHYKTPVVLPLSIAAIEWEGLLPQEVK